MPYNIIFRHSDTAAYKMWETAKALVPVDALEITSGKRHLPKNVMFGGFLAWVLRVEHPGARLIGKFFKTTKDCTKCGLCINACPTKNIKINKNGKVVFGGSCMMCMRCAFNCPHNAIKMGLFEGWKVNGKYSFAPPTDEGLPDKHAEYCIKAYNRYYENAQKRLSEHNSDKPNE